MDRETIQRELHEIAQNIELLGHADVVEGSNGHKAIAYAIPLLESLAAEVERLTPKPMTLQDAINVLNAHAYGDGRWSLDEQYGLFAVDPFRRTLTTYDAVAVAEKLLREKEAKA